MSERRPLPPGVLPAPVSGVNLVPGSFRQQLAPEGTLLVFLRQLGCTFCRETVSDLRACAEADPAYPRVLFVFMGSPREGRGFMQRYWPAARAISDPEKRFYAAFGVARGSLFQMFGPAVWRGRRIAREKGHENGERVGDLWMLPGIFLIREEQIVWTHHARHAADHPDFPRIPVLAAAQVVGSGPGTIAP